MTTIQQKAQEALRHFEYRTRNNGDEFWAVKDEAPEWITDLCHRAHSDMMPDDWRYEFIHESLVFLAEGDTPEDAELEPDIYNRDLLNWLASNLNRPAYCDEYMEETGADFPGIMLLVACGQSKEKNEVLWQVHSYLEDLCYEEEE